MSGVVPPVRHKSLTSCTVTPVPYLLNVAVFAYFYWFFILGIFYYFRGKIICVFTLAVTGLLRSSYTFSYSYVLVGLTA